MTSKWCRDKAVVVVVYAEKPQGESGRRRNHHHQFHENVTRNNGSRGRGRGYSRRAELLHYARNLREPAAPSPSPHINQHPTTQPQVSGGDRSRKQIRLSPPTCFGKWGLVVTRFLRTAKAKDKEKMNHKNKTTKMKALALVKTLQVHKKGSFISKLLAALHKRR